MSHSIGPGLRAQWCRFTALPGGKWIFNIALGRYVPYTGSIGAKLLQLEPGLCAASLRDRRTVRHHLGSIHAMALANLGEMVTGLALMNSLPDKARGILTGFSIDYLKKARGTLTAECRCEVPVDNTEREYELSGEIRDAQGDTVSIARARWLVGPEKTG